MSSLVYRIETEFGRGAYRANAEWGYNYPGESCHPGPEDDAGLKHYWSRLSESQREAHYFGFCDEKQMRAWFYSDTWIGVMKNAGLRLTVWEVQDSFCHGRTQSVFRKDMARLIESRELQPTLADPNEPYFVYNAQL